MLSRYNISRAGANTGSAHAAHRRELGRKFAALLWTNLPERLLSCYRGEFEEHRGGCFRRCRVRASMPPRTLSFSTGVHVDIYVTIDCLHTDVLLVGSDLRAHTQINKVNTSRLGATEPALFKFLPLRHRNPGHYELRMSGRTGSSLSPVRAHQKSGQFKL
ncbi:hypothetical protein BC835DRAFT_348545 [Cytidiella melzeri]|nr:hypothetical protein BC835DRAFT_348545 [Cytidiella melzeri]